MTNSNTTVINALNESLENESFIKLSLGQYKGAEHELKNIYVRKVTIKRAEMLGFTYRYKTRDITKNYTIPEGVQHIINALGEGFYGATLLTADYDLTLDKGKIKKAAPSQKAAPSTAHDRDKNYIIRAENSPYLHALKITDAQGNVYKNAQDKFRQINKYVEIMSSLVMDIRGEKPLKIVDIGAGKGYLTFALYDHLQKAGQHAQVIGVEYRDDLVNLCNNIAKSAEFSGLHFVRTSAGDYDCAGADVVIALHACDTATDDAIAKGVLAGASTIVVSPCCHKQIRREMESNKSNARNDLDFMLDHGIYRERTAEMVTDGLRGLMLEYHGYAVKIFEFISGEHTAKNILIVATKAKTPALRAQILERIQAAKSYFGIKHHYLEQFLLTK